ncbi:MAG: glycoside hydrolase family 15 protein [Thermodesulfobacteriota bacterium]|nr:glycoside hydrolase family 15 protein [Thermodesulfobacteriota bacterium]
MPRDIPVGNGSLLINFDANYQLRDIYYPYVGQENHTTGQPCRFGVWVDQKFRWLDDPGWQRSLKYLDDSLITEVELFHPDLKLKLICHDAVDFHVNLYLKKIIVHNLAARKRQIRLFFGQDLRIAGHAVGDSVFYEPENRVIFHYKGKRWFLINTAQGITGQCQMGLDQWAVGVKEVGDKIGTWFDAEDGELSGNPVAQGSVDSVVALHLEVPAGSNREGWYWICVGEDYEQVTRIQKSICEKGGAEPFLVRTRDYWRLWANKEKDDLSGLPENIAALYRRSLLVIRTQIDNHGAILAANDYDIADFNHDTYSYMWPRDGALVASALIDAGYSEISRRFFRFCHQAITREGYLLHKYNPDGSLASSWHGWYQNGEKQLPIQEDETALVLWALWRHFDRSRDIEFIKPHYRGLVIRAANWMLDYRDPESGLPLPSWDLWEERRGVHAWTVGAVWGGLDAAARFAEAFGQLNQAEKYRQAAQQIKEAAEEIFWRQDLGRFVRTVNRNGSGDWEQDLTLDASLMGLWYFGMFPADHEKIRATMEAVKERLWVKTKVGGLARYEDDYYHQVSDDVANVPGNPWFVSTLWLAQWLIAIAESRKDLNQSLEILNWATAGTLSSGIMAEQIHPYTNAPLSVSPLTWSHATFVKTVGEYLQRYGELKRQG